MVDFNVRTYSEDDGRIIGAEVTVISTSGDNLGSISVANAETLAEMQAQLAVIDETYFTEERLAEILENINESQEINATKLSGFVSSDFAKVSQLSAYAPASHTHPVSQITNLYDYQITASAYNVNIDSNVNITVKVTNRATGRPVTGVTVPVLKNNSTWKSGTTGVNGTFQLTYTADTWGLTTFSANNSNVQVNVTGWKVAMSDTNYDILYNNELVSFNIHISSGVPYKTSESEFGAEVLKHGSIDLRPKMPLSCLSAAGTVIAIYDNSYKVKYWAVHTNQTGGAYAHFTYKRK